MRPCPPLSPLALALVVVLGLSLAACGEDPPPPPPQEDAGTGPQDAGGEPPDAGGPEGGCDLEAQNCDGGALCLELEDDEGLTTACVPGCAPWGGGCSDGERCAWITGAGGTSARTCVPAGDAGTNDVCSGTTAADTCVDGHVCLLQPLEDGGTEGRCRPYCHEDGQCAAGERCFLTLAPEGSPERPRVCEAVCELLAQDCDTGEGCYPGPVSPACYPAGTLAVGDGCTWSDECVPGAACSGDGVCVALCGTAGMPACAAGACTAVTLPGASGVGVCL